MFNQILDNPSLVNVNKLNWQNLSGNNVHPLIERTKNHFEKKREKIISDLIIFKIS